MANWNPATAGYVLELRAAQTAPVNTAAPVITGDTVGDTLTVDDGTWTGADSYTYAWTRNDVTVEGADTNELDTTGYDADDEIVAIVTAHNERGSVPQASDPVILVAP